MISQSNPLTIEVENNRISRTALGKQGVTATNFALTRAQTKTATASANLPSAPTSRARISSATFCRTKKFPAFTSRLVIPTPNTPAQNWASKTHIDCVGRDFDIWFDGQQVMREGKFLI